MGLAGFSLLLHDAHMLREKLTVVSRRLKGSLVRGVFWLETLRFCLDSGVQTFESPSELSRAQKPSTGSSLSTVPSAAVPPERSSVAT